MYNGWKNHATWNVALWIGNDQGMHEFAKECGSYQVFVDTMRGVGYTETPDKVAYNDSGLDVERLDELIKELNGSEESTEAEDEAQVFRWFGDRGMR